VSDKIAGHLEVGINDKGEVVVNHPDLKPDADGVGHIVFSPQQARALADTLKRKSDEAECGTRERGEQPECCPMCLDTMCGHRIDWRNHALKAAAATRAALAQAMGAVELALSAIRNPITRETRAQDALDALKVVRGDPTCRAAHDEWLRMQTVVEAADRFARMAPPWGHVDRFKRLEELREALATVGK
jgi:hypothetical protein